MHHVMIDLETFSTSPKAAIVSIGAVKFDPELGDPIIDTYYTTVDLSAQDGIREYRGETILWWLRQSAKARAALRAKGISPREMIGQFEVFFGDATYLWAKPTTFDVSILTSFIEDYGETIPWDFRRVRDLRTLEDISPSTKVRVPVVPHNALDDAKAQASVCISALRAVWYKESE